MQSAHVRVNCCLCVLYKCGRVEIWRGENSEGRGIRAKGEMERRVRRLKWEVEWLPGLRSGSWPLMSIWPFGAYCRVRGLDFYGDGFHLLESSLSVSLHFLLSFFHKTPLFINLFFFFISWLDFRGSLPFLLLPLLSSSVAVYLWPHQPDFPNAHLSPPNSNVEEFIVSLLYEGL